MSRPAESRGIPFGPELVLMGQVYVDDLTKAGLKPTLLPVTNAQLAQVQRNNGHEIVLNGGGAAYNVEAHIGLRFLFPLGAANVTNRFMDARLYDLIGGFDSSPRRMRYVAFHTGASSV